MEESEARRLAERFCRGLTDAWDERGFELDLLGTPAVLGAFVFAWYPTAPDGAGRPARPGGNLPVLVDPRTGTCRQVRDRKELRPRPGPARSGGP
ncbi:hypothetical protein [Streptomyces sp. NPDC090112]|uniref:hypothetical protein n=1 Tax=Streptomyces sp. NPDC090112 TaxID=3365949 RepID=UPI00380B6F83